MFRFRIRTLLICITVIAVLLAAATAGWNKGVRHEQLQKSLVQHKAYVVMSHQTNVKIKTNRYGFPKLETRSTLPSLFETTGLSRIFRRIYSIHLKTSKLKAEEIDLLLADVRSVGSFNQLMVGYENTPEKKLVDLVNDVSIHKLVVTTDMLWASKGQWITKDLKSLELMGAAFSHYDLTLLPLSVEELFLLSSPDTTVDEKSFARFQRLKVIYFLGDATSNELIKAINENTSIQATEQIR